MIRNTKLYCLYGKGSQRFVYKVKDNSTAVVVDI